ncbi:unnamed protein product [Prorocentrum cordatum]|uniref:Uncharacterized protein n=1 Tax=Prorocentrum cordatum TaxID=2364126 RepID=A0ABN9QB42_9DINO|nr:unnamed protein product [Polarella glacialis]
MFQPTTQVKGTTQADEQCTALNAFYSPTRPAAACKGRAPKEARTTAAREAEARIYKTITRKRRTKLERREAEQNSENARGSRVDDQLGAQVTVAGVLAADLEEWRSKGA